MDFGIHLPITDPTWIFFLVLMIILFAPILLGRLRIPHIIGMILAGVVIGKYGFNILERDSSFELFGKVGIYYIMFLAGLEMDLENLKKNWSRAFVFGILTFVIPFVLGMLVALMCSFKRFVLAFAWCVQRLCNYVFSQEKYFQNKTNSEKLHRQLNISTNEGFDKSQALLFVIYSMRNIITITRMKSSQE